MTQRLIVLALAFPVFLLAAPISLLADSQLGPPLQARGAALLGAASDYVFVDGFDPPFDCSPVLSCPLPQTGKSCISGKLIAAGSGMQLRAQFNVGLACGNGAIGGPCDLTLTPYDALQYVINPGATPPLSRASSTLDGCGRFRFVDITPPGSGNIAVAAEDAGAAPGSAVHVLTVTFHSLGSTQRIEDVTAVATLLDTVTQWTQSAGSPFGASSFSDVGAMLLSFRDSGFPRSGVTVVENGSPFPTRDYYFSDTSLLERLQVDSLLSSTGANGSALYVNGTLTNYSGAGGEPLGCSWPSVIATTIAGTIVFVEINC
jgi:hypothetical protein